MRFYLILILTFISKTSIADDVLLNDDFKLTNSEDNAVYRAELADQETEKGWPAKYFKLDNGTLYFEGFVTDKDFSKNNKTGPSKYYHNNGKLFISGPYNSNGHPDGLFEYYNEDGIKTKEHNFKDGYFHGLQVIFHNNGMIKKTYWINKRKRIGFDVTFNEKGTLKSITGKLDKVRHGKEVYYYSDGSIAFTAYYQHGNKHGPYIVYKDNGVKSRETHYENDVRHGPAKTWHDNGELWISSHFIHGNLDGKYYEYTDSGLLSIESNFRNGNKIGEQKEYHQDSKQLRVVSIYDQKSRLISRNEFDTSGIKKVEETISYDNKKNKKYTRIEFGENGPNYILKENEAKDWKSITKYDTSGQLTYRKEFVKNKAHGLHIEVEGSAGDDVTYEERIHYRNGKRHGDYQSTSSDGEFFVEGRFADDNKVGRWITKNNKENKVNNYNQQGEKHGEQRLTALDGTILEVSKYRNGDLHGKYEAYNKDGSLHAKGNFVNNKRDGKWQYQDQYTSDKNVWFGTYNKGKKIGLWLSKSEAGYITAREQYDESGKEKGTFYTFTADGLLKNKETYLNGQRHGQSILYVSGEPISITTYDNGREIDTK